MNIKEIKTAVDQGKTVHWCNDYYTVKKTNKSYDIICGNGSRIGLHGKEGTKYEHELNGKEKDFFIKD